MLPLLFDATDSVDIISLCTPCNRRLLAGKVPLQGQINNLALPAIPKKLSRLNSIEQRLISQVHPYIKLVI